MPLPLIVAVAVKAAAAAGGREVAKEVMRKRSEDTAPKKTPLEKLAPPRRTATRDIQNFDQDDLGRAHDTCREMVRLGLIKDAKISRSRGDAILIVGHAQSPADQRRMDKYATTHGLRVSGIEFS